MTDWKYPDCDCAVSAVYVSDGTT